MRRFAALWLLSAMVLAGCLGGTPTDADEPDDDSDAFAAPGPITAVTPVGEDVLVSPPGHRMAEFMITSNPLDPDHLALGVMDYDSGSGGLACVIYISHDGGKTWVESEKVPGLERPHLQFDQWVSFDRDGVLHYLCLDTAGNGEEALQTWPYYSYSEDGGTSWAPAVLIPRPGSIDKSALIAGSDGRVYAAFSGYVARTDDLGESWLELKQTEAGSNPNGFVEDSNGTIFLWVRGGDTGRVAYTEDGGETWNHTDVGPFAIPPGFNDQNRWVEQRPWTTLPSIAIHPHNDHIFVAQQSWNTDTSLYETTVYRSTDHGRSFDNVTTPPFASPTCSPCHVAKPSVHVDDAGRVGLSVQILNDGGHRKEVWFTASSDEGKTWVEPIQLSEAETPNSWANPNAFTPNPESAMGVATHLAEDPTDVVPTAYGVAATTLVSELQMRWNGEYWGLESSPEGFVVPWIDHRADGVPQLYVQLVKAE